MALEPLAQFAAETELGSRFDEAFRAFKQVIRQVLERRRRMNVRCAEKMGGWLWPEAAVCTAEWVSLKLMTRVIITVLLTPPFLRT